MGYFYLFVRSDISIFHCDCAFFMFVYAMFSIDTLKYTAFINALWTTFNNTLPKCVDKCVRLTPVLTHWGGTHKCVDNLNILGSDNGLLPGRHQAIIWTNAGILFIGPLGTNFSEILIEIHTFSFKKLHLKMSSAKWRLFVSASMC